MAGRGAICGNPVPDIDELMIEHTPEYTIVMLGANQFGYSLSPVEKTVRDLKNKILAYDTKCMWVGLTDKRDRTDQELQILNDTIRKGLDGQCRFFSPLQPDLKYPSTGGDGVHFSGTSAHRRVGTEISNRLVTYFWEGLVCSRH
jgi:hypothetical protein